VYASYGWGVVYIVTVERCLYISLYIWFAIFKQLPHLGRIQIQTDKDAKNRSGVHVLLDCVVFRTGRKKRCAKNLT
jgi:hypothetical protein